MDIAAPDAATAQPAPGAGNFRFALAVALLLTLLAVRLSGTIAASSVTIDEPIHVASGVQYLRDGAYAPPDRMWMHPPLARVLEGWLATRYVERHLGLEPQAPRAVPIRWIYETGVAPFAIAQRARLVPAFFLLLLAVTTTLAARRLHGRGAALVVLTLIVCCPTLVAHGSLATTDMPIIALGMVVVLLADALAARPSYWRGLALGVAAGLGLITKYNALLLAPVVVGLLAWGFARADGRVARRRLLGAAAIAAILAYSSIWAGYGFDREPIARFCPPHRSWQSLMPAGVQGRVIDIARSYRLLPEGYIYGYIYTNAYVRRLGHWSYFLGQFRLKGWAGFFPVAVATKTPLPTLGLVIAGVVVTLARRPKPLEVAALAVAGLTMATAIHGHLALGVRHVLLAYPFLFLIAGAAARRLLDAGVGGRAIQAGLLAVLAWSSGRCHPHELAYFNALGGGPEGGHAVMVDSNHDWGQALPALAAGLRANGVDEPIWLAPYGGEEPGDFGIRWRNIALPDRHAIQGPAGRGGDPPNPSGSVWVAASTTSLEFNAGGDYQFFWSLEPVAQPGYAYYLARVGGNPRHLRGLAELVRRRGDLEPARALAEEALRLEPDSARTLQLLGRIVEDQGEVDDAECWYEESARQSASWSLPRLAVARLMIARGDADGAKSRIAEVETLDPPASGWLEIGDLLATLGDRDHAIAALLRAEDKATAVDDERVLREVAPALVRLRVFTRAIRVARAAVALRGGERDSEERRVLAKTLKHSGHHAEAAWIEQELELTRW